MSRDIQSRDNVMFVEDKKKIKCGYFITCADSSIICAYL